MKLKVGDRVKVIKVMDDLTWSIGKVGILKKETNNCYFIQFDEYNNDLHDASGRGKHGHCWSYHDKLSTCEKYMIKLSSAPLIKPKLKHQRYEQV